MSFAERQICALNKKKSAKRVLCYCAVENMHMWKCACFHFLNALFSVRPVIVCTYVCLLSHQISVSPTLPLAHSFSACVQWALVEPLMSSLNTLHRARVVGPPAKTESRHKHWSLSDLPPIAALLCAMKFICNLCYQPLFVHACVYGSVVICLDEQVIFCRWVLWEHNS